MAEIKDLQTLYEDISKAKQTYIKAVEDRLIESGKEYKLVVPERYTDEDYGDIIKIRWNNKWKEVEVCILHDGLQGTSKFWGFIRYEYREPKEEIYHRIIWEG